MKRQYLSIVVKEKYKIVPVSLFSLFRISSDLQRTSDLRQI